MSDEQYAVLNAKLDAILARLQALEERPVTVNVIPNPMDKRAIAEQVRHELRLASGRLAPGYNSGGIF